MKLFDANFAFVLVLLVLLGALAWGRGGGPLVWEGSSSGLRLFVRYVPVVRGKRLACEQMNGNCIAAECIQN